MSNHQKEHMAQEDQSAAKESKDRDAIAERVITLHLQPDVADGLESLADAQGSSIEECVLQLVKREISLVPLEAILSENDRLIWEDGLLVYRTGNPLSSHVTNDAIDQAREERIKHILGDLS